MSETNETKETTPLLTDQIYDALKHVVQIILPAFATLYFTLAAVWGLPWAEQIVGTSAALATFGGALLAISNRSYQESETRFDGDAIYSFDDNGKLSYTLAWDTLPEDLLYKDEIVLHVKPEPLYPVD